LGKQAGKVFLILNVWYRMYVKKLQGCVNM
jgi:hypothetical protein